MSVWQRRITVNGKEYSAKEYIAHFYKSSSDKEIALILSAALKSSVSSEDVRCVRRRSGWIKEPWKAAKGTISDEERNPPIPNDPNLGELGEAIVRQLQIRPIELCELSERLDRSKSSILSAIESLQSQGYGIVVKREAVALADNVVDEESRRASLSIDIDDEGWFSFAIVSDTQLGSVWEQPTALSTFIEWAYSRGVRLIFHPGDVCDGANVYKGHWLNLYARMFEEQEWLIENRFPQKDGLRYVMIGGNHDYAWFRQHGRNIMHPVCQKRDDILYLGYVKGTVVLRVRGHEYKVILWHPSGGVPYAKSYRLQRGGVIELFREFAKRNADGPKLLAILAGHLHIRMSFSEGGVLMMQCGGFQSETPYLEEKGLLPEIGGYLVRMHVGEDGFVDAIQEEWRGFQPIEDDWKNWPTPQQATDRTRRVVYLQQHGEEWKVG